MFASFGGEDYTSARKEMIRHEAEERGEDIPGGTGKLEPIRVAAQRIHEIGDMLDEFMAGKGSSDNWSRKRVKLKRKRPPAESVRPTDAKISD